MVVVGAFDELQGIYTKEDIRKLNRNTARAGGQKLRVVSHDEVREENEATLLAIAEGIPEDAEVMVPPKQQGQGGSLTK